MKKQKEDNINIFIKDSLLKIWDYDSTEAVVKPPHKYNILF